MALGLAVGLPAGLAYHARLHRALGEGRPRGWWLRPTALHARLAPSAWRAVRPPFVLGAAGFLIILLGCLLAGAGALRAR